MVKIIHSKFINVNKKIRNLISETKYVIQLGRSSRKLRKLNLLFEWTWYKRGL
jgi:hypothetical protein